MRPPTIAIAVILLLSVTAPAQWTHQSSGVEARFRGVSAVSERVAWASGTNGTVVRTLDGGDSWEAVPIPSARDLDLRDIDAFDENTAYALSIGNGDASRIFKTEDGGHNWQTQFVNQDPAAFFDAMSFWEERRGLAVSDSVNGQFVVLRTDDGGLTWSRVPADGLPPALPGEGYFAASGTNVFTWGEQHAWFGTGAADQARVARSTDGGKTWEIAPTPLAAGSSAGIFSIAFRDAQHGVVVGGDYQREEVAVDNVAVTRDGGRTWNLASGTGLSGFRSAVGYVPGTSPPALLAVGPSGADYSTDDGDNWIAIPAPGFHTLSFTRTGNTAWAAGDDGRISRFEGGR